MGDQGTRVAADASLRSILRALDEEDAALAPLLALDGSDWLHWRNVSGAAIVCRYERLTAADADHGAPTGFECATPDTFADRRHGRIAGPLSGLSLAAARVFAILPGVPIGGLLLASVLLVMPAPSGEWARAALETRWLEQAASYPVVLAPARPGDGAGEVPQPALRAFSELAQRAFNAATSGGTSSWVDDYSRSALDAVKADHSP